MKASIYARVSTTRQEEEGTSLETQTQACRDLALSMGYEVDDAFIWRVQESGVDPDRPGLANLKHVLLSGEVATLFVYTTDRIARDPLHLLMFREELDVMGVRLQFVNGPSGDSPEEKLVQYLLGYVGQRERLDIVERTNRGKRKVAESGRLPIGTGAGLYGYDYDKVLKQRRVNEHEAAVVAEIFTQFAEGISFFSIAKGLNERGLKTKRGKLWNPLTVRRMLGNSCYKGETWYGKARHKLQRGGKVHHEPKPEQEWILVEGFTPAIISDDLWEQVQKRLAMPRAQNRRPNQRYLLTGFARCYHCNAPLTGASQRGQYRYYSCRATRATATKPATCRSGVINADDLEAAVWNKFAEIMVDPKMVLDTIREYLQAGNGNRSEEIKRLRSLINRAGQKERKLVALYANDLFDEESLVDQVAPIKEARTLWEKELAEIEEEEEFNNNLQEMERRVMAFYGLLQDGLATEDFDGKRAAMNAFDVAVLASKKNVMLTVGVAPALPTDGYTSEDEILRLTVGHPSRSASPEGQLPAGPADQNPEISTNLQTSGQGLDPALGVGNDPFVSTIVRTSA